MPVALIAVGRDDVIPRSRTDALRARVPRLVFDRTIEGASHNDLYVRPKFDEAMRDALAALTSGDPAAPRERVARALDSTAMPSP